jgi:hypothetical protein
LGRITGGAIALNVGDPEASAEFALPTFKPDAMAGHDADGVLVALVMEDVDAE